MEFDVSALADLEQSSSQLVTIRECDSEYANDQFDTWCTSAKSAISSPILHCTWLRHWVKTLTTKRLLQITLRRTDTPLALATFCKSSESIMPGVVIKQLWLHRTGDQDRDQIWIEHNDCLVAEPLQRAIWPMLLSELVKSPIEWDEIYIGMTSRDFTQVELPPQVGIRTVFSAQGYIVDLQKCTSFDAYLSALSSNTRSQIRRSIKLLRSSAPFELKLADSTKEKAYVLAQMSALHKERWSNSPEGSGFDNPHFVDFHQSLVFESKADAVRLYYLTQNNVFLGGVYLLVNDEKWDFYLSALKQHADPKIKIGYVIHSLIIKEAIEKGVKVYDFLAGDAQYKRSLSNTEPYTQDMICIYRKTPILMMREWLRGKKQALAQWFATQKS